MRSLALFIFLWGTFCFADKEELGDLAELLKDPNFSDKLIFALEKRLSGAQTKPQSASPECKYSTNHSTIIKTQASIDNGAVFIGSPEGMISKDLCIRKCCDNQNCTVAVVKETESSCYLFNCGTPSKCLFSPHPEFSIVSIVGQHSGVPAATRKEQESHAAALENLATTKKPSTTTASTPAARMPATLFGACKTANDCMGSYTTCIADMCLCQKGFHEQDGVCMPVVVVKQPQVVQPVQQNPWLSPGTGLVQPQQQGVPIQQQQPAIQHQQPVYVAQGYVPAQPVQLQPVQQVVQQPLQQPQQQVPIIQQQPVYVQQPVRPQQQVQAPAQYPPQYSQQPVQKVVAVPAVPAQQQQTQPVQQIQSDQQQSPQQLQSLQQPVNQGQQQLSSSQYNNAFQGQVPAQQPFFQHGPNGYSWHKQPVQANAMEDEQTAGNTDHQKVQNKNGDSGPSIPAHDDSNEAQEVEGKSDTVPEQHTKPSHAHEASMQKPKSGGSSQDGKSSPDSNTKGTVQDTNEKQTEKSEQGKGQTGKPRPNEHRYGTSNRFNPYNGQKIKDNYRGRLSGGNGIYRNRFRYPQYMNRYPPAPDDYSYQYYMPPENPPKDYNYDYGGADGARIWDSYFKDLYQWREKQKSEEEKTAHSKGTNTKEKSDVVKPTPGPQETQKPETNEKSSTLKESENPTPTKNYEKTTKQESESERKEESGKSSSSSNSESEESGKSDSTEASGKGSEESSSVEKPANKVDKKSQSQDSGQVEKVVSNRLLSEEAAEKKNVNYKPETSQGAIIALALGLAITAMLLMFVGCRLRTVKHRLRRGRPMQTNEADYLINGMYL